MLIFHPTNLVDENCTYFLFKFKTNFLVEVFANSKQNLHSNCLQTAEIQKTDNYFETFQNGNAGDTFPSFNQYFQQCQV